MFKEMEITPELLGEFQRQQIIVAHNEHEVWEKERELKSDWKTASIEASRLEHLIRKWKGYGTPWSVLNGMRVLDLASGSGYTRDFFGDIWYPQFARLCAVNGAEVVAIDAHPQRGHDQTLFEWADADLVDVVLNGGLQSLPILQGRQFDLINSANFVGINWCPELPMQLAHRGLRVADYESRLLEQAGELLSESGIMTLDAADEKFNRIYYTKVGDTLTPLPITD